MITANKPPVSRKIKTFPPPPSPAAHFKDPIASIQASQIALLDPTGARTALFSKSNPESARVGDILLVRLRNGDPYAGVCINIRRRGVDTGILLRNELTRVGVEMWYKIYSPNVEGIEVVQRKEKRARRARLTYLRKKKHDVGSVQGVVGMYLRQRAVVRGGGRDGGEKGKGGKKTKGRKLGRK
jgi:large subunit ribosomal protein L19